MSRTSEPTTRVLLCDDATWYRMLLRTVLDHEDGIEVVGEAPDGATGIVEAERHQPDVVLLDLAMPVMDGLEALPQIRVRAPHAVVVVLSGLGRTIASEQACALGAAAYVEKGVDPSRIVDVVRSVGSARLSTTRSAGGEQEHEQASALVRGDLALSDAASR